jgi:hypothetical protein
MKIKPKSMWRELEQVYEQKIITDCNNFANYSEIYDKMSLQKNMLLLRAVKDLRSQVIKYNLKQVTPAPVK